MRCRARRGSQAVEFALTLPIFVLITSGIVDWGWYFERQFALEQAVQVGARTTAATDADDGPEAAGEAALTDSLNGLGIDPTTATTLDCTLSGTEPDILASCTLSLPYSPYVDLVPTPALLGATVTMRFEDQDT